MISKGSGVCPGRYAHRHCRLATVDSIRAIKEKQTTVTSNLIGTVARRCFCKKERKEQKQEDEEEEKEQQEQEEEEEEKATQSKLSCWLSLYWTCTDE